MLLQPLTTLIVNRTPVREHPSFLSGGGECGLLIRSKDWTETPLGHPTTWPATLRHAVRFMLHATLPVYIAWGPKLIRLYNDSYIPTLGPARHPRVLGTSLMDEKEIWSAAQPLFERVLFQGESISRKDFHVRITKSGAPEDCYFDLSYTPLYNDDDSIGGIQAVFMETTDKVRAINQTVQGIQRFRSLVQQAPVPICVSRGPDFIIEIVNDAYLPLLGLERSQVVGKPAFDLLPQARTQLEPILQNIMQNGEPFELKEFELKLNRYGREEMGYFNALYQPMREDDGSIWGIMTVAHEITDQIIARKTSEENEAHFKQLIDTVPAKIWMTDPTGYCTYLNPRWYQFTGQTSSEALGYGWLSAVHPDDAEEAGRLFTEANEKQQPFLMQYRLRNRDGQYHWAIDTAKPRFAADGTYEGMIGTVVDVNKQKEAEEKIKANERQFRSFVEAAPIAIVVFTGPELVITNPNQIFIDIFGKGPDIGGKRLVDVMPELITENQPFLDILSGVFTTGVPFQTKDTLVKLVKNGVLTEGYYDFSYTPLYDNEGKIYAILEVAAEVTQEVLAQKKLVEAEKRARLSIEAAELGTLEHDFATGVTSVSQKALEITGLPAYASSEDFAAIVHPDDLPIRQAALEEVVTTGVLYYEVRVFLQDRSIRWIKVRGDVLYGPDDKPTKIVGVVQDITDAKTKEEILEAKVAARTQELAQANNELRTSNEELSQYAYIASHDLQEPLRKIRIFSGMLGSNKDLPPHLQSIIEKIDRSAGRMSGLIKDLLDFSQLAKTETLVRPLKLNEVVQAVVNDFELLIQEKGARIEVGPLPVVEGVALQMNQLFYNLIGNALKFSSTHEPPVVQLHSQPASESEIGKRISQVVPHTRYHHLTVMDNGIGFDSRYVEKIFEIFKRLHTKDIYAGSGIGLALCRRIVANHKGAIWAEAHEGSGARFHILLPEQQTFFESDAPANLVWKND